MGKCRAHNLPLTFNLWMFLRGRCFDGIVQTTIEPITPFGHFIFAQLLEPWIWENCDAKRIKMSEINAMCCAENMQLTNVNWIHHRILNAFHAFWESAPLFGVGQNVIDPLKIGQTCLPFFIFFIECDAAGDCAAQQQITQF